MRRDACGTFRYGDIIKGKMLAGVYILQSTRASFNQTKITVCQLCNSADEDMPHFLTACPTLSSARKPSMSRLLEIIPRVYLHHPATGWSSQMMTQLILDCTHPTISEVLPLSKHLINLVEKESRILCFALHRSRCTSLGDPRRTPS